MNRSHSVASMTKSNFNNVQKTSSKYYKHYKENVASFNQNEAMLLRVSNEESKREILMKDYGFMVMMLSYVFYHDDQNLSRSELKQMKSFILDDLDIQTKKESKNLIMISRMKPTTKEIDRYRKIYKINDDKYLSFIKGIETVFGDDFKYDSLVTTLKKLI